MKPTRRSQMLATTLLVAASTVVADPVKVVTSIPDLKVITEAIGGEAVEVESIVKGNRDVHAVELMPSLLLKVRRADVYVKVGLDLDIWSRQLIDGSRNARLVIVDASANIEPLEVPTFKVDASHGDLHKYGNPHYWLDPANVRPIGEAIVAGLARVAPASLATYKANLDAYVVTMESALATWQARLAPFAGAEIISFHNSWPYFANRFGLRVVDFLEPKPGVPPTPSHVAALQELLRSGRVRAILMESYFDDQVPEMLSRTTGVPLVKAPVLVGASPEATDQLTLFETITTALAGALAGSGGS